MSIIMENQRVKAGICLSGGCLDITFEDDPSYIRSETVLVDLMQRSIGLIFENAYHHIGDFPANFDGKSVSTMANARLSGQGAGGREIELHAPIKIVGTA